MSLGYFEWSAPDDADLDDPHAWAMANPAKEIRIVEETIRRERDALRGSPEVFARERMGIWEDLSRGGLFNAADWAALADPPHMGPGGAPVPGTGSQPTGLLSFSADVTPDRSRGCIAVAAKNTDGFEHREIVEHEAGTAWIVPKLVDLAARHGDGTPAVIVLDPASPAGSLIVDATEAGLTVTSPSTRDYQQACGQLFDDIRDGKIRHLGQLDLDAAVAGARKKNVAGEAFIFDRRHSGVNLSPLVAITTAGWGLHQAPEDERSIYETRGMVILG